MSKYSKEQTRIREAAARAAKASQPSTLQEKYKPLVGKRVTVYRRNDAPETGLLSKLCLFGAKLESNVTFPWIDITAIVEK